MKLNLNKIAFVIFSLGLMSGCVSESERLLTEKIESRKFDFTDFKVNSDDISWNISDGIQYGFIHLKNGENVKFWFLSHHLTSDIGGTIYEYSNGKRQYCSGLHCCEVQFYENGKLGKTFENDMELKRFVSERDGIKP